MRSLVCLFVCLFVLSKGKLLSIDIRWYKYICSLLGPWSGWIGVKDVFWHGDSKSKWFTFGNGGCWFCWSFCYKLLLDDTIEQNMLQHCIRFLWNLNCTRGRGPSYRSQTCSSWLEKVLHGWPRDFRSQQKRTKLRVKLVCSKVLDDLDDLDGMMMMMMMMMMMLPLLVLAVVMISTPEWFLCSWNCRNNSWSHPYTVPNFGGAKESFQKCTSLRNWDLIKTYAASPGWDHYRRHLCREAQRTRKIQWEISRTGSSRTVPWPCFSMVVYEHRVFVWKSPEKSWKLTWIPDTWWFSKMYPPAA